MRSARNRMLRRGALSALLAGAVLLIAVLSSGDAGGHRVSMTVPHATALVPGFAVRLAGRRVGEIESVKVTPDYRVRLVLRLDDAAWPLPRDTRFVGRLGGTIKFGDRYVEIDRGHSSQQIADGATLPASTYVDPVEFDSVFNVFDAATRHDMAATIRTGAGAMAGLDAHLAGALRSGPAAAVTVEGVMRQLGDDPASLNRLVQSAAGVADAAAAADPGLGTLIDNSRATFHAVAQRAGDLRATLDQMPPTLEAARRSLAAADTTLRTAQQLSGRLEPGITQVRALARPLASLLQTVGRVAPVGTDALRTLGGAAPSLNGLLDRARTPVMPTVEGIGRQAAKQLDCIRPYSPEIGGLFVHWAGFFGIGDGKSKITRAQAGTVPYNNETTANSGQLKQVLGDSFGMAFPRPPGELAGQSWFQPQCGITVVDVKRSGTMAKATLAIDGAKVPLPEDTRAALRLRTLVGESYIELYPGRSRYPLKSGGMLPLSQDVPNVEADEVLSVLRGATRVRAREFIQRLGAGIDGQGPQLNDFLHHATGAIDHASDVAAVLAHDHQDVGDLVQHVGDIMREIGDRSTAIRQLAQDGTTTFQALADRELALRRTLDELPPSLAQVRSTTGTLSAVAGSTAPMLSNLAAAVRELGPAVHALGPAASAGQGLVDELAVAAPRLRGTVGRLTTLAPPTVRALPQVRATLCQLNPMAQFLRPYAADGVAMISNMASATNFYDATGHAARLYAIAGPTSVAGLPPTAKSGIDLLFKSGVLGKGASLGYDPYPAAGTAQQPGAGAGMTGPADHPRFPRVQAEC